MCIYTSADNSSGTAAETAAERENGQTYVLSSPPTLGTQQWLLCKWATI